MVPDKPLLPGADPAAERLRINAETARIDWRELQRFFAQGYAIYVDPQLDLVEVALEMQNDNKARIEQWLAAAALAPVSDAQARDWFEGNAVMWCVVVRPWVLVQPVDQLQSDSGRHLPQ